MRKPQIAIIILASWLTIVSVFMILVQQLDLEIFFVLSLIGFLAIVHLMEPSYVQPGYLKYLWYVIAIEILIFCIIIIQKVIKIIMQ
jgi:hypothetical protein